MAEFKSHVKILRTFGKFLRDERHKIDTEYVTNIKPVISEIKYEKYSLEELHELIVSIDEVLDNFEIKQTVGVIESDLQKALVDLERAKSNALKHKNVLEVRNSMIRQESGRKVGEGHTNDSGCFSVDSRVLSTEAILVTQASDADQNEDSTTSRVEATQHEDKSELPDVGEDSTC